MRAVLVERFGGPEVMTAVDWPEPVVGPGQVLIASKASDVMYVDVMIRSGAGRDFFRTRPPYTPGNGVGGEVIGIGQGVSPEWLGRAVIAHTGGPGGMDGYAERAVADIAEVVQVPGGVDLLDALAVLHDGTTAIRVCDLVEARPRDWVLVLGAAGGMGILTVQILRSLGARVVGAARGKAKLDVVAGAGADESVDYGDADWTDRVLEVTGGVRPRIVLDGVGGDLGRDAYSLVSDGGRFSAHGTPSGSFAPIDHGDAQRRGVKVTGIVDLHAPAAQRMEALRRALAAQQSGRINPLIGQTFPLEEASRAHALMEARESVAKTLLLTD